MAFDISEIRIEMSAEIHSKATFAKKVDSYPARTMIENGEVPESTKHYKAFKKLHK